MFLLYKDFLLVFFYSKIYFESRPDSINNIHFTSIGLSQILNWNYSEYECFANNFEIKGNDCPNLSLWQSKKKQTGVEPGQTGFSRGLIFIAIEFGSIGKGVGIVLHSKEGFIWLEHIKFCIRLSSDQ